MRVGFEPGTAVSIILDVHRPLGAEVRGAARGHLERAIAVVDNGSEAPHVAVHEARKRCKRVRALLRLVRPDLGELFQIENVRFRDASRRLSPVRDATASIETMDRLAVSEDVDPGEFFPGVRSALVERRDRIALEVDVGERLRAFREDIEEGHSMVSTWPVVERGFDTIAEGLRRTYARGRRTLDRALEEPSEEALHEWRKRTKYHFYQLLALRGLWEGPVAARAQEANVLEELLGESRDLELLRLLLRSELQEAQDAHGRGIFEHIAERRAALRALALPLGQKIFAEPPGALVERFGTYWNAARAETLPEDDPVGRAPSSDARVLRRARA